MTAPAEMQPISSAARPFRQPVQMQTAATATRIPEGSAKSHANKIPAPPIAMAVTTRFFDDVNCMLVLFAAYNSIYIQASLSEFRRAPNAGFERQSRGSYTQA